MKTDRRFLVFGGLAAVCLTLQASPCSAQQTPADGISAQIRAQGYRCDVPVSAERDPALSRLGRGSVDSHMPERRLQGKALFPIWRHDVEQL